MNRERTTLVTSLEPTNYKKIADKLALLLNGIVEGDDPNDACEALIEYGYCDEDGFWIDEE